MASSTTMIVKSGGTLSGVTQVGTGQQVNQGAKLALPINDAVDAFSVGNFDYIDIVGRPNLGINRIFTTSIYSTFSQPGHHINGSVYFTRLARNGRWLVTDSFTLNSSRDQDVCEAVIGTERINQSVTLNSKKISTQ